MTTKTVWYRFTASTTQLVAADTLGSDYYTVLAVYRGADVAALTPVACNENYFGQTPFLASAGTTYYFQVGGPFGANGGLHNSAGRLVFNLRAAPPPSMGNDDFGEALEILDPLPYTNSENTAGATSETNEPSPCGAIGTTVWYRFTPSSDRTLIADTFGSNFDTALAVYTGADLSALTLQGCSDNFPDFRSSVKFKATAGTTYYVQAGGAQGIAGDLALHLVDAPSPCAPSTCPQFVLGIDVDNDGQDDCNTRDGPTTCVARQDDRFALHVYLDNLGSAQSYGGFDLVMTYAGVSSKDNADAEAWPDCAYEASAYDPGFLALACAIGVASPNSVYTGLIGTADFNCTDSGVITMLHGYGWTALVENLQSPVLHEGETISETLIIDCALDIDSDGDGCSDDAERQTATGSELSGGRRDYLNSHDYFNPTGDGQNRLDDVLAVLDQYSKDDNDQSPGLPPYAAGYNPDADRTLLGPNAWNLGPPNGLQRVDDILNIVKQYFHDCS